MSISFRMKLPFASNALVNELRDEIAYLKAELEKVKAENRELVNAATANNRLVQPFRDEKPKRQFVATRTISPFHEGKRLEKLRRSSYEMGTMPGRPAWSYNK